MNKSRRTGSLNISSLSTQLQERFRTLLNVAEKKAIFSWIEVPIGSAEVVVIDNKNMTLPVETPPCLAFVGSKVDAGEVKLGVKNMFQVDPVFTVSQLLDLLDRAAIRLLDRPATTSASASTSTSAPEPSAVAEIEYYKLQRWVMLPKEFDGPRYMMAIALLTRGQVTLSRLCSHTELQSEQATLLIAELNRQRALLITRAHAQPPVTQEPVHAKPQGGLFVKLSRWLSQSRSLTQK